MWGDLKFDELKPMSHKKFDKFIKGRGFRGTKNYALKDLKGKFGFKPLAERRELVVSLGDMEPTTFGSMMEATEAIGMGEKAIRYARNNGRDFIRRFYGRSVGCFP